MARRLIGQHHGGLQRTVALLQGTAMPLTRRQLLLACSSLAWPLQPVRAAQAARAAPLLARVYEPHIDPAPYLVSEKYDGVRGLWDGHTLRFRSGRVVPAPAWFTARLPREALDGELWLGRQRFDELSAIVRTQTPDDAAWRQVRYMVFEAPGADPFDNASSIFAQRTQHIADLARRLNWPQLLATPQERVSGPAQLMQRLAQTVSQGGEGLMLHLASAPTTAGRSDVLLKLKPQLDAEATVLAHQAGRGRYAGQLGALQVRGADGQRFMLGSGLSDEQRQSPPAVGTVVTYRYRDLTPSGLPRFATFLRVHHAL